ncbi:hypothetical protein HK405_014391, partial [Cladochytrium tenue]
MLDSLLFGHLPTNLLLDEAEIPPSPPPIGLSDNLQQDLWADVALDLIAAEAAQSAALPDVPSLRRGAARWKPPPSDVLTGCVESAPVSSIPARGVGQLLHPPLPPVVAPTVKPEAVDMLRFELAAWADAAGGAVAEVPTLQLHGDDLSGLFAPGGDGGAMGAEAAVPVASMATLLRCDEGLEVGNEWETETSAASAMAVTAAEAVRVAADDDKGGDDGGDCVGNGTAAGACGNEKNPSLVWHGYPWTAKHGGQNPGGAGSGGGCDGERAAGKRAGCRKAERGRLRGRTANLGCSTQGAKFDTFAGGKAGEASWAGNGVELRCEECGRDFTRPDTLAVHRFKHLPYASRPFACQD